ncbi:MAG TPA: methyltransferase domain-containing protein [Streptosporangiaceae bacterium]
MVGDPIHTGGGTTELTAELRADYDAAAADWARGPASMYALLARSLVAEAPVPLGGGLVLDLGAGTGVAGRAALAAGARRVVAADLSEYMLRHVNGGTPVVADAVGLPFRDGAFDLVLAAFCLNHLDRVEDGLTEARRVSAATAASAFAPGWTHPAKDTVDDIARSFGYQPPDWYTALAPGSRGGDPEALAESAAAAGFTRVQVRTVSVPVGLATPAGLVSWRLGLAHYAPFLRSLGPDGRAALRRAAERALASSVDSATGGGPLVVEMVVLTAS